MSGETQKAKLVLLLRTRSQSGTDPYEKACWVGGLRAVSVSVLDSCNVNTDTLRDALLDPAGFSGLVITSQRAVSALASLLVTDLSVFKILENAWSKMKTFVVGKATSEAAIKIGLNCHGEQSGSSEELAKVIIKEHSGRTEPLLFLCGNMKRETIPEELTKAGISLRTLTVYDIAVHPNIEDNINQTLQTEGQPEFVVFFSPSGVRYTAELMRNLFGSKQVKFVAIGATTAAELSRENFSIFATAATPTAEGLVTALKTPKSDYSLP